uniref:MYB transcription factor n=1 Tax=Kalanchoe fedtschenkoi TaxID=63787 RepID=A0A7N0T2N3_KALFE
MVSVHPNSAKAQSGSAYFHPMDASLPGLNNSLQPQPPPMDPDDSSKKIRKPYVISKSRESWTDMEHDMFVEALHLFDRDWKKIEAFVGSKTVIQIRSHAQKYFLKVQKNGMTEHVPPPRPKRKAAHPYPQKASKIAHADSQFAGSVQPTTPKVHPGYALPGLNSISSSSTEFSSWTHSSAPPLDMSHISKNGGAMLGATGAGNFGCSSSNESSSRTWCANVSNEQGNSSTPIRFMPDFAQVYNFIGSVFDPDTSGHLQKLKTMDPINVETALLLMRNLAINLTSPEFEDHRQLLESYDVLPGKGKAFDNIYPGIHQSAISTS